MKKLVVFILSIIFLVFSCWVHTKADEIMQIQQLKRLTNIGDSDEIIRLIENASQQGLPIEGLLNKVKEGNAKRIEREKILNVLYNRKRLLLKAQELIERGEQRGLRVWDSNKKESIESFAQSMDEGVDINDIENFMQQVINNNDDIQYLTRSSSAFAELLKVKISRSIIKDLITLAIEKRVDINAYSELVDFMIEAKQYDYPLQEVSDKLKQGMQNGQDLRSLIFDIKFSR
ncbi:MAG: hypothetical protein HY934_02145 [Candidatus Firestonebacteria bacterium]|nr:hypothetical protein [Candidatus Firestonebacteria bacterium]